MMECPECGDVLNSSAPVECNCCQCARCGKPVFVIRDPFDPDVSYSAIANSSVERLGVPDDVLLGKIVDQSPIDDTPRHMIIEFGDGDDCVIAQVDTNKNTAGRPGRRSLEKTAVALNRRVLVVQLPVELMGKIRDAAASKNGG